MRNLHQNPRTIARICLTTARAAMFQVLQNRQPLLNDRMGFFP